MAEEGAVQLLVAIGHSKEREDLGCRLGRDESRGWEAAWAVAAAEVVSERQ